MNLASCPNATIWQPSCKRRSCPVCGVRWARDWYRVMRVNLEAWGRPVAMIAITPPGSWRLPWDEAHCAHRRRHTHSGPKGCRVQGRALREWCDTLSWRWHGLRSAARNAVINAGFPAPLILERVWEPQKRGTPHLHLVVPFGTLEERRTAELFAEELQRLSRRWDFGNVDKHLKAHTGAEAAAYLASYLTGRSRKKGTIRENIADPRLPRSLIWLSWQQLTSRTFVTMRTLRRARHLFACTAGKCDPPAWRDERDAITAGVAYARAYARRTGATHDPPAEQAARLIAEVDRRIELLPPSWHDARFWARRDRDRLLTSVARVLAGLTPGEGLLSPA